MVTRWAPEEDAFIRDNIRVLGAFKVAMVLRRDPADVAKRAERLGPRHMRFRVIEGGAHAHEA